MISRVQHSARFIVLGQMPLNKSLISIYFNVSHCIINYAKGDRVFVLSGVLNAQL